MKRGLFKKMAEAFVIASCSFLVICYTEALRENESFKHQIRKDQNSYEFFKINKSLSYTGYLNNSNTGNNIKYDLLIPKKMLKNHLEPSAEQMCDFYIIRNCILRRKTSFPEFYKTSVFVRIGLSFFYNLELAKTIQLFKTIQDEVLKNNNMILWCNNDQIELSIIDGKSKKIRSISYGFSKEQSYDSLTYILSFFFKNYF